MKKEVVLITVVGQEISEEIALQKIINRNRSC